LLLLFDRVPTPTQKAQTTDSVATQEATVS